MTHPDWALFGQRLSSITTAKSTSGLFVTFEGIDGAGKTTTMHGVCEILKENGIPYTLINSLNYALDDPILVECADWANRIVFRSSHRKSIKHPRFIAMADAMRYVLASDAVIAKRMSQGELVLSDSWCVKRMIKLMLMIERYECRPCTKELCDWVFQLFKPALFPALSFHFLIEPSTAFGRKIGDISASETSEPVSLESERMRFINYQSAISSALREFSTHCRWSEVQAPASTAMERKIADKIMSIFASTGN